jgi:hypothetical protein
MFSDILCLIFELFIDDRVFSSVVFLSSVPEYSLKYSICFGNNFL